MMQEVEQFKEQTDGYPTHTSGSQVQKQMMQHLESVGADGGTSRVCSESSQDLRLSSIDSGKISLI